MRTSDTIGRIFTFVTKYLQPSRTQTLLSRTLGSSTPLNRTLGISTPPNRALDRSITSSPRAETFRQSKKGIKRVEQQSSNTNTNHSQKFDDYGIWVASKLKPTPGHSEQPSMGKQSGTVETPRRLHLSLSTSLVKDSKGERAMVKGLNLGREDSYSYDREDNIISGSKPSLLGRSSKVGVRTLGGRNQLHNSKYL